MFYEIKMVKVKLKIRYLKNNVDIIKILSLIHFNIQ